MKLTKSVIASSEGSAIFVALSTQRPRSGKREDREELAERSERTIYECFRSMRLSGGDPGIAQRDIGES